jgi:hypothetical protein
MSRRGLQCAHLHEPIVVVVQITGISLIDLDYGNEVFVGDENLVVAIKNAGQVNPSPQSSLEL